MLILITSVASHARLSPLSLAAVSLAAHFAGRLHWKLGLVAAIGSPASARAWLLLVLSLAAAIGRSASRACVVAS